MHIKRIDIENCINNKSNFALFRLPQQTEAQCVISNNIKLLYDIESLNGKVGFIVAPFNVSDKSPIAFLNSSDVCYFNYENENHGSCSTNININSNRNIYERDFNIFMEALRADEFQKLVLARCEHTELKNNISLIDTFICACNKYPLSYVYLLYTEETGFWIGATPEKLLSGLGNNWSTVALAGTQKTTFDNTPLLWDEKNKAEQAYVSKFIRTKLSTLDIKPSESNPHSVMAGNVAHLKTDFNFTLTPTQHISSILKLLHPTPAVCGLPERSAFHFILNTEHKSRKYYSGFLGMITPHKETDIYVNLRCMNIDNNNLYMYAGSGLLKESTLEDEWQETEDKLQTMISVICTKK